MKKINGGRKEREKKNLVGEERRKRERNGADYVRSVLAELLLHERKQKQVLSKEMYICIKTKNTTNCNAYQQNTLAH